VQNIVSFIGLFCKRDVAKAMLQKRSCAFHRQQICKREDEESRLLKIYVSFAEYRLFYTALLQKRSCSRDFAQSLVDEKRKIAFATALLQHRFCNISFAKEPYKRDDILHKRPIF